MQNSRKKSVFDKHLRSLWKPTNSAGEPDITVPVHMAYCGIAAALRQQVRAKTSSLAIIAVADPDSLDSYVEAGRLFLRQRVVQQRYDGPFVRSIRQNKKDKPTEFDIYRRAAEAGTGILFCAGFEDIDEELMLFADLVAEIPKPTERQINATLRRYGHAATNAEETLIQKEPWKRLVYAFLPGRPVVSALRRLRDAANPPPMTIAGVDIGHLGLEDLHGFGEAREWGMDLAKDIRDFKKGLIGWDEVDSGLLVSGAPGTGKTLFAKALAITCEVPIVSASAAQWQAAGSLDDLLRAMNSTFKEAHSKAPCILFIDEADSFGNRGINDSRNSDYKRQVINGLLEQLDGFQRRTGVIVIGATNYPENLDPAITRPGRLDRHVVIPLPDGPTRCLIFEQCSGLHLPDGDVEKFMQSTAGMSGASIKQVVRNAKRAARRVGDDLSIDHVFSATRPLAKVPAETLRIVAVHEAGHAIVGAILGLPLEAIAISDTVVTDGTSMLGGAAFKKQPFAVMNKEYYLNQLRMLLGGIAAEALLFKGFESGVIHSATDLARATALATQIEACLGFGDTLAVEIVEEKDLPRLRSSDPELKLAVRKLLDDAFDCATSILSDNIDSLRIISAALERHRFLSNSTFEGVLSGADDEEAKREIDNAFRM